MEDADLVKALGPYKIDEKTDSSLVLKYTKSLHIGIYIYTIIWAGIAIFLKYSNVQLSALAVFLIVLPYLAFCSLFRYIAIKNAIVVIAEKGFVRLKYKKFFNREREVFYDSQSLNGIQPYHFVSKQTVVAAMRIVLKDGKDEFLYFAGSEKTLAIQRSETIASLFAQVLGIQLLK